MFTHNDIEYRTILTVNTFDNKHLRVQNGELLLEERQDDGTTKTLTKIPFQKLLAIMVIGGATITTPLIDKCKQYNVALIVMKSSLRPVFYWANSAEANYLLRQKQYALDIEDSTIAKHLINEKIHNQLQLLKNTRRKDINTLNAIDNIDACIQTLPDISDNNALLGLEGNAAKAFFGAYYQDIEWHGRKPRTKCDILNVTLDIGYTLLFNYIECFVRMFGFDIYIGVYHRLWFKRKSLICDLIEPFRCIIDRTTLSAFHRQQFKEKDFKKIKGEYKLNFEETTRYYRVFLEALIPYKTDIFRFIQSYYRAFMSNKDITLYPKFRI